MLFALSHPKKHLLRFCRSPVFRVLPSQLEEPKHSDLCVQDLHRIRFTEHDGSNGKQDVLQSKHEDTSVEESNEQTLSWSWDKVPDPLMTLHRLSSLHSLSKKKHVAAEV